MGMPHLLRTVLGSRRTACPFSIFSSLYSRPSSSFCHWPSAGWVVEPALAFAAGAGAAGFGAVARGGAAWTERADESTPRRAAASRRLANGRIDMEAPLVM